ncbi:hypothetical protein A3G12_01055 [Candidatus Kaiserbacteria bacterium RIFCSPLOWO2_12_FULL_54_10]|nr:MAG: hypothetical protein A3G12_01055 [Candidatus Kaiserbacteria bacterium RIFCSPLOWO2_12_FULL_54_10]
MRERTIVITGVSSGLGKALFDELHSVGERLICISRRFLEEQKAGAGENVSLLACDLSKSGEVERTIEKLRKLVRTGEVIFIDNAAIIQPIGSVGALQSGQVNAAAETNFISPIRITNALAALIGIRTLTVIHVSTGAARHPIVGWPLYCATKAGLKMFYAVVAAQEKSSGRIRVHEFDPGIMDTPMQAVIREASPNEFPRSEEFKNYKKDHELSDPHTVAKRLIREYIQV